MNADFSVVSYYNRPSASLGIFVKNPKAGVNGRKLKVKIYCTVIFYEHHQSLQGFYLLIPFEKSYTAVIQGLINTGVYKKLSIRVLAIPWYHSKPAGSEWILNASQNCRSLLYEFHGSSFIDFQSVANPVKSKVDANTSIIYEAEPLS